MNQNLQIKIDQKFFSSTLKEKVKNYIPQAKHALNSIINKQCVGKEWTGWFNYPENKGFTLIDQIQKYINSLNIDYDTVLVIGIGGSYLGTRAIDEALNHTYKHLTYNKNNIPVLYYIGHHLSEQAIQDVLDVLQDKSPIVCVISKSGTTTEPAVAFRIIRHYLQQRYSSQELSQRIIAITDPQKGALRQLALEQKYKIFEVPQDIGGRYSVLSAVGMLPLALAKINIQDIMQGAHEVFKEILLYKEEHPSLQYACCRKAAHDEQKTMEILSYCNPKLAMFAEWFKQLFGESEGKTHKGLYPTSLCFTTDLHSLGQYVQDGKRSMIETFLIMNSQHKALQVPQEALNIDELQYLEKQYIEDINTAAMLATKIAHYEGGVPCLEIITPPLCGKTLGALIAFFETACAISGLLLNINPFDQPGVENYKKNLFALMKKPGFENIYNQLTKFLK